MNIRTVTSRNSPSVINAVFNHRNNWDGSASFYFNGVNNAGKFDPDARVLKANFYYDNWLAALLDRIFKARVRQEQQPVGRRPAGHASLASQAMTTPLKVESAWIGRDFKTFVARCSRCAHLASKRCTSPIRLSAATRIGAARDYGSTMPTWCGPPSGRVVGSRERTAMDSRKWKQLGAVLGHFLAHVPGDVGFG